MEKGSLKGEESVRLIHRFQQSTAVNRGKKVQQNGWDINNMKRRKVGSQKMRETNGEGGKTL